jgi:hypothetical protein
MSSGVIPLNIDFIEWASQIRIDFPTIDIPVPPEDVNSWWDWASQVVNNNGLTIVPLPTSVTYPEIEDWRNWGAYFINSILLG